MLNPSFRRCKTHLPFEHITSIKFLPHHHHPGKNKSIAEKRCLIAERNYIILFHKHTFRRTNILVLRTRLSWYYLSSSLNVLTGLHHDYTYLELLICIFWLVREEVMETGTTKTHKRASSSFHKTKKRTVPL